jgi:hypothetical protein
MLKNISEKKSLHENEIEKVLLNVEKIKQNTRKIDSNFSWKI